MDVWDAERTHLALSGFSESWNTQTDGSEDSVVSLQCTWPNGDSRSLRVSCWD